MTTGSHDAHRIPAERDLVFRKILLGRNLWYIRLRWLVPPVICAICLFSGTFDLIIEQIPVLFTALLILIYNTVLYILSRDYVSSEVKTARFINSFSYFQVSLDYTALFVLIHYTGGAASPLILFLIFHVVFAAILLPTRSAFVFAFIAVFGILILVISTKYGIIQSHSIIFRGRNLAVYSEESGLMARLIFYFSTIFITAFLGTAIIKVLRDRMANLDESATGLVDLNRKLETLYSMIQAMGTMQHADEVIDIARTELASVMNVKGISLKLLDSDRSFLRYAASFGLPPEILEKEGIEVDQSPLNRRIIDGESFVTGNLSEQEDLQYRDILVAADINSVLFVPLRSDREVIGILGAYCPETDRFNSDDVRFFSLAADLVTIAIINARAYEEIQNSSIERSRFMMQVAHNLRAPLAACISMLDVVRSEYLGTLSDSEKEHLRRVDRRMWTMVSTINDLMTLAGQRTGVKMTEFVQIDLNFLVLRLRRTFQDEAARRGLNLVFSIPENLPELEGDLHMIEQMLENLISNALKYTLEGSVEITFSAFNDKDIRIDVKDTGIGIPYDAVNLVFSEFFRAPNALDLEETGTGLGLTIVRETVEKHRGSISVSSDEGRGTIFSVDLPIGGKKE